jgi:hypothetical protein
LSDTPKALVGVSCNELDPVAHADPWQGVS